MTPRLLGLAAVAVILAGLFSGSAAALLGAPIALGLLALAAGFAPGGEAGRAPWGAAAGASTLGLAVACAASGSGLGAAAAAVTGVGLLLGTASDSLRAEPAAQRGRGRPNGLASRGALLLDELARFVWRVRWRLHARAGLDRVISDVRSAWQRGHEAGESFERFHLPPPLLEKPTLTALDRNALPERASGGVALRFESEFQAPDPEIRDAYEACAPNRTAHATWLRAAGDRPRPIVVCVGTSRHLGLASRDPFDVARLLAQGLDVVRLPMPFEGDRRSPRSPWIDGHPLWLRAVLAQSVWDLRRLVGWLRREGARSIALSGEGLGGAAAVVTATLDRRIQALVARSTPASLADRWLRELGERERLALEAHGLSRAVLEDLWAPVGGLAGTPRTPASARLLIAGAVDRVCPPSQVLALQDQWEGAPLHWHPGGTWLPLGQEATAARLDAHLRDHLVAAGESHLLLTRFRGR